MLDNQILKSQLYKILLLGETNVGKTSLKLRFVDNSFVMDYKPTLGVDYNIKYVKINNNQIVKLSIWDTAGQERYRSITKAYMNNVQGIVLCFDITNKNSFDELRNYWIDLIRNLKGIVNKDDVKMILVGTKLDKQTNRKVNANDAKKFAADLNINYFETSAMKNINIDEVFNSLAADIHKAVQLKNEELEIISKLEIIKHNKSNNKIKCCS